MPDVSHYAHAHESRVGDGDRGGSAPVRWWLAMGAVAAVATAAMLIL